MDNYNIIKKTLFVIPFHAFSYSIIRDSGVNVLPPYRGSNKILPRILRELHFRMKIPFKQIWFYPIKKQYECFFIFEGLMIPDYIEWLHTRFPSSTFVMFYMNKCTKSINPDRFPMHYLYSWTGDLNDSKKYGIHLVSGVGAYVRNWVVIKEEPIYDVFFVGKDKGRKRLEYMLKIEKEFNDIGLKTYFHMVAERKYEKILSRHYKDYMPYRECLNYLGKTKAILYLGFGSQECVTIRVQESLVHKIKLITDCIWIKKYDFYTPSNIFILGEDDISNLSNFLNSPYVAIETDILKHIYFEDLAEEILKQSSLKEPPLH